MLPQEADLSPRCFLLMNLDGHALRAALAVVLPSNGFSRRLVFFWNILWGMAYICRRDLRKVFQSWSYSKSMLRARILQDIHGCFRERYPSGTALIVHYGHGMHRYNVRRSSHHYPDFGSNARGTAYLHGCYVVW